jgi:hypothetical protein
MAFYDEDEEETEESGDSESEKLLGIAQLAFPDQTWDEDRLSAFKELIAGCSGHMPADEEDEDDKPKGEDAGLLEIVLGSGKPKKK